MIVGEKFIDIQDLLQHCKNADKLKRYTINLVPKFLRGNKNIVDNQKYLVALEVRKLKSLNYYKKKYLTDELLKGITIHGSLNFLYSFDDILMDVDIDKLKIMLEEWVLKIYEN